MAPLDQEDVVEQCGRRREASTSLERQLHPRRVQREPGHPLVALEIRVVQQLLERHGNAHSPSASAALISVTAPSFSPRTPASIALRSPTTTTANLPGWI